MIITWTDKRRVLLHGHTRYKAGDVIPAGILTPDRLTQLVAAKSVKVEQPATPIAKPVEPVADNVKSKRRKKSEEENNESPGE